MTSWSWWAWLLAGIGWSAWLLIAWILGRVLFGRVRTVKLVTVEGSLCDCGCNYLFLTLSFKTWPAVKMYCAASPVMVEKLTALLTRGGGRAEDP